MKYLISILILFISTAILKAQELPGQIYLGISFHPVDTSDAGVPVVQVVPDATAANAGLMADDILTHINNVKVNTVLELLRAIKDLQKDDAIELKVLRDQKPMTFTTTAIAKPKEESQDYEILHDRVAFQNGYLNAMLTLPKNQIKPAAIMLIQGYPCASIENMGDIHPYQQWMNRMLEHGYAIYRVEKPGIGRSVGTDFCNDIDINTEINGFLSAYLKLKENPAIDSQRIFIFGHSMGSVVAPMISTAYPPAGIITYGSVTVPWFEYTMQTITDQLPYYGVPYDQLGDVLKIEYEILYKYLIEKWTPEQILAEEKYADLFVNVNGYQNEDQLMARHYTFWQSLQDLDLIKCWTTIKCPVLALHGESDVPAVNDKSAKMIRDIVNAYHPNAAQAVVFEETNHFMQKCGNKKDWFPKVIAGQLLGNPFNEDITNTMKKWMEEVELNK